MTGAPWSFARSPATRRVVRALLLGVGVSVAVTLVSRAGLLAGWETRAVDAFLFVRERVPSPDIVLVVVDEEAFRSLGERQPLSRRYLADLGDLLLRSGARVVSFDVQLAAAGEPDEDGTLIALAERRRGTGGGRLVFATAAIRAQGGGSARYALAPLFSPALAALPGFANAPVDSDGVIRRMAAVLPAAAGGLLPSFALAALAAHAGLPEASLSGALRAGSSIPLPTSRPGGAIGGTEPISLAALAVAAWRIDFVGPPGTFTTFPSGPLVDLLRSGGEPAEDNPFREKIVLVGGSFRESRDFYATPLGTMSGVEVHANMLHTLLSRRALMPPPALLNLLMLTGACVAVALLSAWLRLRWVILGAAALVALLVAGSYEAYTRGGYWLDFVAPLLGMMGYLQGSRLLARRRLARAFGEYVSPEVMERVLRDGAALGGEVRTVSVLMSDLRGFTTLSERLPPAAISAMMNEYFTAMVDVILARRGMVQDFIGDAIMAVFGAPVDDPAHAWQAVETALDMHEALARLNARWEAGGRAPLAMGVAVHTGEVFAGNVGSPRKKKYAVLGDTVNTASRLEGVNRDLGTAILISGATLAAVRDRVVVRSRGEVMVKGRTRPVEVFELAGGTGGGRTAAGAGRGQP
jgi:adenylate cyclase